MITTMTTLFATLFDRDVLLDRARELLAVRRVPERGDEAALDGLEAHHVALGRLRQPVLEGLEHPLADQWKQFNVLPAEAVLPGESDVGLL